MANKIFVSSVVALWLSSMTWLVSDRILPSLLENGKRPTNGSLELGEKVAWIVSCNGVEVGRAASVSLPGQGGSVDLFNRLKLQEFPLLELAPSWMRIAVGEIGKMSFEAETRIEFDPLGNFASFHSKISLNELPSQLQLSGRVKDSCLELKVRAGTFTRETPVFLNDSNALNEALFPAARIENLKEGSYWQEEVYSPFRTAGEPVELVRAEVLSAEQIPCGKEHRSALRVEYRGVNSAGVPDKAQLLAVAWVEPGSGDVLRRDIYVGTSKLRFQRVSQSEAEVIGAKLFEKILRYSDLPQSK